MPVRELHAGCSLRVEARARDAHLKSMAKPAFAPAALLKRTIVEGVRATFNDKTRGEAPVERSTDALFAPDSVTWRVHGDVTTMMIGGFASLMLQMLHPAVLAGVWDHSRFREDSMGRLRRTARFIAVTTFGPREAAAASIARVRRIHAAVRGTLPDGTPYVADDPRSLAWVHATESLCFLDAWVRYGDPRMSRADQDRYFAEVAQVGRALGADPVYQTRAETLAFVESVRRDLCVDNRTREVAQFLMNRRPDALVALPAQNAVLAAAIDLLPDWARRMHALPSPVLLKPLVRAGAAGLAGTLRWAFR